MKHKKILDEEFEQLILSNINNLNDLELIILKGHILVEYALNKFIDDLSHANFEIIKENFQFYQKIKICKSLGLFKGAKSMEFEKLFLQLNSIRNSIAHHLEYDFNELNKLFVQFAKYIENTNIIYNTENDVEKMKSIIIAICGNTIGIKMGDQKIKKFKEKIINEKYSDNDLIFIDDFKNFK